jgi:hypothetical protein
MKEATIRVLALHPHRKPEVITLENTLEAMQAFVGGLIDCIPIDDTTEDVVMVLNDEGKLMGLEPNRWLWDGLDFLVGSAFLAAGDAEGNLASLTEQQIERYSRKYNDCI